MAWETIIRTEGAPAGTPLAIDETIHGGFDKACAIFCRRRSYAPEAPLPTHVVLWSNGRRKRLEIETFLAYCHLYV